MVVFSCPVCKKRWKTGSQSAGRVLPCRQCNTQLVVPEQSGGVAPYRLWSCPDCYAERDENEKFEELFEGCLAYSCPHCHCSKAPELQERYPDLETLFRTSPVEPFPVNSFCFEPGMKQAFRIPIAGQWCYPFVGSYPSGNHRLDFVDAMTLQPVFEASIDPDSRKAPHFYIPESRDREDCLLANLEHFQFVTRTGRCYLPAGRSRQGVFEVFLLIGGLD